MESLNWAYRGSIAGVLMRTLPMCSFRLWHKAPPCASERSSDSIGRSLTGCWGEIRPLRGRIKKSNPIHRKFYLQRPNPRSDNIGNWLKIRTGPTMNLLGRISALALLTAPTAVWAIAPDLNTRLAARSEERRV